MDTSAVQARAANRGAGMDFSIPTLRRIGTFHSAFASTSSSQTGRIILKHDPKASSGKFDWQAKIALTNATEQKQVFVRRSSQIGRIIFHTLRCHHDPKSCLENVLFSNNVISIKRPGCINLNPT